MTSCMKDEAWTRYADAEVLARVTIRLIEPGEKTRWDNLICERHYLKNANLVGRQLRYVAELDGQWIGLLGWNVAMSRMPTRLHTRWCCWC